MRSSGTLATPTFALSLLPKPVAAPASVSRIEQCGLAHLGQTNDSDSHTDPPRSSTGFSATFLFYHSYLPLQLFMKSQFPSLFSIPKWMARPLHL